MRKISSMVGLLAVVLVLSGCGAGPSPTPSVSALGFEPAPWSNGSTADYQWQNDASGEQVGTSQFRFDLSAGVWTMGEGDHLPGVDQNVEMRMDATTLAPLGETKTITSSTTTVALTTTYESGKLDITAVVNGKTQTASLDVPSNAVDNDQLLMTLRALPFADGYQASYVVVVAQNALKVDTTVTVQGQETVTVPAGPYECWRVEIAAGQVKQSAWYQVALPNNLVQYDNGTNRMLLTKD